MASKTEHSVSEDKAKGQKGVTQDKLAAAKTKIRTTSPKIPSEPLRLVVRVDMKVTSATKNRTAHTRSIWHPGRREPPLRLFAPPLPGAQRSARPVKSAHLSLPPGCGNRRLALEGIIERSLAVVTLIFATAAPGHIVPAPALSILLVRSGPSLEPLCRLQTSSPPPGVPRPAVTASAMRRHQRVPAAAARRSGRPPRRRFRTAPSAAARVARTARPGRRPPPPERRLAPQG